MRLQFCCGKSLSCPLHSCGSGRCCITGLSKPMAGKPARPLPPLALKMPIAPIWEILKGDAAAGLAAALPGVLAAHTTLPVIGVPVGSGALNGLDSLYSIVQMPPGVPVATVGIDNSRNAAMLAAQILALSDEKIARAIDAYRDQWS